jgi:hypothetical protein
MAKVNESATNFLFAPHTRPYWTFRNATAVVVLATFVIALVRAFVTFPAEQIARWESRNLLDSPLFLSLYYVFVAIVLWLVHATDWR